MTLNGLFGKAAKMPEVVVHASVLSYCSNGPICTSSLASVLTITVLPELGGIVLFLPTCTKPGVSSRMSVTSCALSLCYSGIFCLEKISSSLKLERTIFRSVGNTPFTNLSFYEASKRTGTAKSDVTRKTTLTLKSFILTWNVVIPTLLTFWLGAFFNAGRLVACTALGHSVSRKFSC